jgi:hypothetical protein
MSIRKLNGQEFYGKAELALNKIFGDISIFINPTLNDKNYKKIILYEYLPPSLDVLEKLRIVASDYGEKGFYLSIIPRPSDEGLSNTDKYLPSYDWWIPFDEASICISNESEVFGIAFSLEHIIYSPNGTWGLRSCYGSFGILAGEPEFIAQASQAFGDMDQQMDGFLKHIQDCKIEQSQYGLDLSWLPGLLEEVCGLEASIQILKERNLP